MVCIRCTESFLCICVCVCLFAFAQPRDPGDCIRLRSINFIILLFCFSVISVMCLYFWFISFIIFAPSKRCWLFYAIVLALLSKYDNPMEEFSVERIEKRVKKKRCRTKILHSQFITANGNRLHFRITDSSHGPWVVLYRCLDSCFYDAALVVRHPIRATEQRIHAMDKWIDFVQRIAFGHVIQSVWQYIYRVEILL